MVDDKHNIFLVGMMGAGKSTVGKVLAQRLGKNFYDADHEIEARTGVKIPVIFDLEGEAGFRKREAEVIDALSQQSNVVMATGGGAVLNAASRQHLRQRGYTIYLAGTAQELWQRTRHDRNRPLLQTRDPYRKLQELLQLRDPLYREVAHLVVETGRPSVSKLIAQILGELARNPQTAGLVGIIPNPLAEAVHLETSVTALATAVPDTPLHSSLSKHG